MCKFSLTYCWYETLSGQCSLGLEIQQRPQPAGQRLKVTASCLPRIHCTVVEGWWFVLLSVTESHVSPPVQQKAPVRPVKAWDDDLMSRTKEPDLFRPSEPTWTLDMISYWNFNLPQLPSSSPLFWTRTRDNISYKGSNTSIIQRTEWFVPFSSVIRRWADLGTARPSPGSVWDFGSGPKPVLTDNLKMNLYLH